MYRIDHREADAGADRAYKTPDMRRRTAWLMFIVAIIVSLVLIYPYLGLDIDNSRLDVPLLLLAQIPFGGAEAGSMGEVATSMIPVGQTLGWIVNLIVVESIIRRRRLSRLRQRA
ncbi:hypothetical protein AB0L53_13135 [Nonomuraea sp. NPDC052129]|uniref:hypothetical protein n=1 Tax=Nonomuraea sp. NPDC052129 TaxID=3154651 RepID=UPI0034274BB5